MGGSLQEDIALPDWMITSRLGIVSKDMARMWHAEERLKGKFTWAEWKDKIYLKFRTANWKRIMHNKKVIL